MLSRLLVEVQAAVVVMVHEGFYFLPSSSAAIDQQPTHSGISVAELGEVRIQEFIVEIAEQPFSMVEGHPHPRRGFVAALAPTGFLLRSRLA